MPSSEVPATIPVGMEPRWASMAPAGSRAYVTLEDFTADGPDPGGVAVIDTQRVIGSAVKWSGSADGLAITPDGLTAFVADRRSRAVRVVPVQSQPTDLDPS